MLYQQTRSLSIKTNMMEAISGLSWKRTIALAILCLAAVEGFSAHSAAMVLRRPASCNHHVALHAKKKRRRKDQAVQPDESPTGDLPDFDLGEGGSDSEAAKPKAASAALSDPEAITPAMMGSSNQPVRSVKDLISDRSLETKFEFDKNSESNDQGGGQLPDLVEMMRGQQTGGSAEEPSLGRKKARQAERQAAAMAREEEESEANPLNFLKSISFLVDEEKGEVTAVKVLEAGTWLGIFLLVSWEVYINSPFFDRAAPLAPIVY